MKARHAGAKVGMSTELRACFVRTFLLVFVLGHCDAPPWTLAAGKRANEGLRGVAAPRLHSGTEKARLGGAAAGCTGSWEVADGQARRNVGRASKDGCRSHAGAGRGPGGARLELAAVPAVLVCIVLLGTARPW